MDMCQVNYYSNFIWFLIYGPLLAQVDLALELLEDLLGIIQVCLSFFASCISQTLIIISAQLIGTQCCFLIISTYGPPSLGTLFLHCTFILHCGC